MTKNASVASGRNCDPVPSPLHPHPPVWRRCLTLLFVGATLFVAGRCAVGLLGRLWTHAPEVYKLPGNRSVLAAATNPHPGEWPDLDVWRRKTQILVSMTFPNVPGLTCDAWCYESPFDFVQAKALEGGQVELTHRVTATPHLLIITTITPSPGAVTFLARIKREGDQPLPDSLPAPNICWQMKRASNFSSRGGPYAEFIQRCFIFTPKGRTFLDQTVRQLIPSRPASDSANNPPEVQSYVGVWQDVPAVDPSSWCAYSPDRYVATVIGIVSRDGRDLAALANESAPTMCQAYHDCMHNNPDWTPTDAPLLERTWRLKIYGMVNDPDLLMSTVAKDFPNAAPTQ